MPASSETALSVAGITLGPLVVDEVVDPATRRRARWSAHLEVPLRLGDDRDLDLFEGGVVAEGGRYILTLEVLSDMEARTVTLDVNDGQQLHMRRTSARLTREGYRCVFVCDREEGASRDGGDDAPGLRLFAYTTGFARVDVTVTLDGGEELDLHSQDVMALSGKLEENEEDERILDGLLASTQNQAAEWMFSQPGDTAPDGRALSSDASTDWADDSVDSCALAVRASLALVGEGIRDTRDAFPTERGGSYDTSENRVTRAFLVNMAERVGTLGEELAQEEAHAGDLLARVDRLVQDASDRYPNGAQLPARTIFEARVGHIAARRQMFEELSTACTEMLAAFDAVAPGVAEVPFRQPKGSGPFGWDPTYRQFREAMRHWRQFADYRYARERRELHVLKPDRLYEYYCLHRLLAWLFKAGFTERYGAEGPAIDHFRYSIEDDYDAYDNEDRCANTYRLSRRSAEGVWQEVDLYYVPVVYADTRRENGITLSKLRDDGESYDVSHAHQAVWTPDFILVVRGDDTPTRTFVMDAKHMDLDQVRTGWTYAGRGLYDRLCERYLDRMGGGDDGMPRPCEVWLLCAYGDRAWWSDGRGGLVRLDTDTTDEALGRLFARFGLA